MYLQQLSVSDPAALEAALEAAPLDTVARVTTATGETLTVHRVPGGWYLPGDLAVASGDIAEAEPRAVALLRDDDLGEYLPPVQEIAEARAEFARAKADGDWEAAETLTRAMDDLDSVGFADAGALRDEVQAWLDAFGDEPYDEGDGQ